MKASNGTLRRLAWSPTGTPRREPDTKQGQGRAMVPDRGRLSTGPRGTCGMSRVNRSIVLAGRGPPPLTTGSPALTLCWMAASTQRCGYRGRDGSVRQMQVLVLAPPGSAPPWASDFTTPAFPLLPHQRAVTDLQAISWPRAWHTVGTQKA